MRTTLAAAALAALVGAPAAAQTVGYADAITILSRSCGADIDRLCRDATLADRGITACLENNRARISGQCASDLDGVRRSIEARRAAQASAIQACDRDVQRLCGMVQPGRGHVLNCLLRAERSVSNRCNQAITNAGWR